MQQIKAALFVLAFGLTAIAQETAPAPPPALPPAPPQLTQVPPKPTCNPNNIFTGTDCQDRINLYNQALAQRQREELQLYVNRQKELASSEATAPLQSLIADQQAQLKKLQGEMQAGATAASQAKSEAHTEGIQQGVAIGAGATLLLFVLIFGVRRLTRNFTVTKKSQAASA